MRLVLRRDEFAGVSVEAAGARCPATWFSRSFAVDVGGTDGVGGDMGDCGASVTIPLFTNSGAGLDIVDSGTGGNIGAGLGKAGRSSLSSDIFLVVAPKNEVQVLVM